MMLLVGLGNPGQEYQFTRHNAGFMAIDQIASEYRFASAKQKFQAEIRDGNIKDHKIMAIKPQNFMNNSGVSVGNVARFYKIPLEQVIVIHDDLDLAFGRVKVKRGGGNGGHNGLKSIDSHLGKEYLRIRIGIAHPGQSRDVSNYVLGKFTKDELTEMQIVLAHLSDLLPILLTENEQNFMNQLALRNKNGI